jgi:hypothetical protein
LPPWRRDHADEDEDRDDERQQRGDGAGDAVGLLALAAGQQRGVHRDEGRRERPFAEEVLQNIRDAERRGERVGGIVAQTEVVREDALADEAGQPAEEDSGGNEGGAPDCGLRMADGGWIGDWTIWRIRNPHFRNPRFRNPAFESLRPP